MSSLRLSWGITPAYHRFPHHSLIGFTPKLKIRLIKSTVTPRPARTSIQFKNDEEQPHHNKQTDRETRASLAYFHAHTHSLTYSLTRSFQNKNITVSTTSSMFESSQLVRCFFVCLASNLQHFLLHLPQTCIRHVWNEYTCRKSPLRLRANWKRCTVIRWDVMLLTPLQNQINGFYKHLSSWTNSKGPSRERPWVKKWKTILSVINNRVSASVVGTSQ